MIRNRMMTELANEVGTDKGTIIEQAHSYSVIYDMLFSNLRDRHVNIMEIGLGPEPFDTSRYSMVSRSVNMWHEYFPSGSIWGIDILDFSKYETDWFKFMQADCGDSARLTAIRDIFIGKGTEFDIIVDDGSHASYHQQLTFISLFPLLRRGGFYIIEDLAYVPEDYEKSLPRVPRTRVLIGDILKYGKVVSGGALPAEQWRSVVRDIGGILTFDQTYLFDLRTSFNALNNLGAASAWGADKFSTARRVARSFKDAWRNLTGETLSPHVARTNLAVIQKRA